MLDNDDLWVMEELPVDEPADLLRTMPEIRQYLDPERRAEEEGGLRSILEHPEALSKAWRRHAMLRKRTHKAKRHNATALRAA